ncbi:MAG: hypothetical protein JW850_06700 [Thermoflexales bacterium]|nr:hypothetical protein [Thermoflexales bacterium]
MSVWLPRMMEEWGLDAKTVATQSGLSCGTIYHLLNSTREPGVETCNLLAPVFGMHSVDLLIDIGMVPPLPEPYAPRLLDDTEIAIMNAILRLGFQTKQIVLRIVNALAQSEGTPRQERA